MELQFGKFNGMDTSEVPFSYLAYLYEADWVNENLFEAVKEELSSRLNDNLTIEPTKLKLAYKAMANKYHPDKKGGSHEAMIAINELYKLLK